MAETKDELRKLAERAMQVASDEFEEKGRLTMPIWLIATEHEFFVVGTPFEGEASKNAVAALIKKEFGEKAVRLAFVSESWLRTMGKDEKYDGIAPSDHPDREEVIVVIAEDVNGQVLHIQRKIERSEGGVTLLPVEVKECQGIGGRFAGMLKRAGTVH